MFINRNLPTLSGQQTGAFDAMTTSALTVTGNASVAGLAVLSSLSGGCITDSLFTYSSTRAASAAAVATLNSNVTTSMSAYLPLSGGNITGPLAVNGMLYASNISVLGSFETVRAYETHSSNVVIDSLGTGPALRVVQSEGGALGAQPCTEFYNGGDPALIIDWTGAVAINKPTAAFELDVSGIVHASGGFVGDGSGLTGLASASAWVSSLTDVYIGAGSNIGIGTTPALGYALDVSGVIRSTGGFEIVGAVAVAPKVTWDTSGSSIYTHAGSNVGIGKAPLASSTYALDVSGNVSVNGRAPFNGIYATSATQPEAIAIAANYAPYDATTTGQGFQTNTFSGAQSTGSAWFPAIEAINSTNFIQTGIANQYVIYTIPANMTMAYINYAASSGGGSMEIYGGATLLCTIYTNHSTTASCIVPVNVSGYTTLKIKNIGTFWVGIQGIGWTISPWAVWKSQYSLEVGGNVNAMAIATGGSTAKQFDCGGGSIGHGATVSF